MVQGYVSEATLKEQLLPLKQVLDLTQGKVTMLIYSPVPNAEHTVSWVLQSVTTKLFF